MKLSTTVNLIGFCLVLLGGILATACSRGLTAREGEAGITFDPNYTAWNTVLLTHVRPLGVDYAGLAASPEPLDRALAEMRSVTPETFHRWSRAQQLAFLINAHNAYAMERIVRHYPVGSLGETRRILPARSRRDIMLLGRRWSLKSLAGEIMGEHYQDSRAIFLINWAEEGCASVPPVALTRRNLDYLADRQTRLFMAEDSHKQYDPARKTILLTPLVKTYRKDLERDYTTLWGFLERFLPTDQAEGVKKIRPRIGYLSFDRSLNQWPDLQAVSAESAADVATRQAETRKAIEETSETLDLIRKYETKWETEAVEPPAE